MGEVVADIIDDWGQGVVTSSKGDMVPKGAYVRGKNCALDFIFGGRAVVRGQNRLTDLGRNGSSVRESRCRHRAGRGRTAG